MLRRMALPVWRALSGDALTARPFSFAWFRSQSLDWRTLGEEASGKRDMNSSCFVTLITGFRQTIWGLWLRYCQTERLVPQAGRRNLFLTVLSHPSFIRTENGWRWECKRFSLVMLHILGVSSGVLA